MNDLTIHQAVAARLVAVTPPTGYALRAAHATPPDNLAVVPAAVCIPGADSINMGTGGSRTTVLGVTVTIYLQEQVDLARKYADLLTWRAWLRSAFDGQVQLGTSGVAQAVVVSTTMGTDTWADTTYLTVSADLQVSVLEGVNIYP